MWSDATLSACLLAAVRTLSHFAPQAVVRQKDLERLVKIKAEREEAARKKAEEKQGIQTNR
jgi:hypothetical protein